MRCRWDRGAELPASQPGSLWLFLTERYSMFAQDPRGRLWRGRIWHEPWALHRARVIELEGNLVSASTGVDGDVFAAEPHCLHAEHLDVRAWSLESV